MKEILFKAKRADNGEWVKGFYTRSTNLAGEERCYIVSFGSYVWHEVEPSTLCQYTGLNGRKFFENDIVKTKNRHIGIIRYGQYDVTHYGFYIDWIRINGDDALKADFLYWVSKIKVIGNIFDNPELLDKIN